MEEPGLALSSFDGSGALGLGRGRTHHLNMGAQKNTVLGPGGEETAEEGMGERCGEEQQGRD